MQVETRPWKHYFFKLNQGKNLSGILNYAYDKWQLPFKKTDCRHRGQIFVGLELLPD